MLSLTKAKGKRKRNRQSPPCTGNYIKHWKLKLLITVEIKALDSIIANNKTWYRAQGCNCQTLLACSSELHFYFLFFIIIKRIIYKTVPYIKQSHQLNGA